MDFCYAEYFGQSPSTGYETLLYDCMIGDATLFHRADIVEVGWDIVAPVLDMWQTGGEPASAYAAGTWGPADAAALLLRRRLGRRSVATSRGGHGRRGRHRAAACR